MAVETLIKLVGVDLVYQGDNNWEISRRANRGIVWNDGDTHYATGPRGQGLCTSEYVHAYRTPLQASFMSPSYGHFNGDRVNLTVEGEVEADDHTKVGCRSLHVVGPHPDSPTLPGLTQDQRIAVALLMNPHPDIEIWARGWLSGDDRTTISAMDALNYWWTPRVVLGSSFETHYLCANAAEQTAVENDFIVPLTTVLDAVWAEPFLGPWDHLWNNW